MPSTPGFEMCGGRTDVVCDIDTQIVDIPGVDVGYVRVDRRHRRLWLSYVKNGCKQEYYK